jgi:cytidine deaminase
LSPSLSSSSSSDVTDADRELYEQAVGVAECAYAPYSRFHVGAAVRARDGRVFCGVNVENAAYPLGICAEKSALARAVTDGMKPGDLEAIAITASPCGGCRQWLVELGLDRVIYPGRGGDLVTATPAALLPDTFEL